MEEKLEEQERGRRHLSGFYVQVGGWGWGLWDGKCEAAVRSPGGLLGCCSCSCALLPAPMPQRGHEVVAGGRRRSYIILVRAALAGVCGGPWAESGGPGVRRREKRARGVSLEARRWPRRTARQPIPSLPATTGRRLRSSRPPPTSATRASTSSAPTSVSRALRCLCALGASSAACWVAASAAACATSRPLPPRPSHRRLRACRDPGGDGGDGCSLSLLGTTARAHTRALPPSRVHRLRAVHDAGGDGGEGVPPPD